MPTAYRAPEPMDGDHRLDAFDCGKPPLDNWLKAHALANKGKASRTFVIADEAEVVIAYYSLAAGAITLSEMPRKLRHNPPNPVPVMVLGRLAIDQREAGRRLGSAMLKEAIERTLKVSLQAGIRALIVHAIDDDAVHFYLTRGFSVFPSGTRTMFLPIEAIRAAVEP